MTTLLQAGLRLIALPALFMILGAGRAFTQENPRKPPLQAEENSSREESSQTVGNGNESAWPSKQLADEFEPTFLQIALAVVREDKDKLRELAEGLTQMGAKSDDHRILAGFSRMVVFQEVDDQALFAQAAGEVAASPRRTADTATAVARRMRLVLDSLVISPHAHWRDSLLESAGQKIWPATDALTIEIVKAYLPTISGYPARVEYIAGLKAKGGQLASDDSYPAGLRATWTDGERELCKLSIELHAAHFKFEPLWTELRAYLDQHGVDDKYSPHLFAIALQTLNRARVQRIELDPSLIPERSWFEKWHATLKTEGSAKLKERMEEAWDVYTHWTEETLPLGPVALDELRFDPRLRVSVKGQYTNSLLAEVLRQVSSETRVSVSLGSETDSTLIVGGLVSFAGPLHSAMRILAENRSIQGNWVRTKEGYQIESSRKGPQERTNSQRFVIVAINAIVVGTMALYLFGRRNKQSDEATKV